MKTQVIVSSIEFRKWLLSIIFLTNDEDILFKISEGKIFVTYHCFEAGNSKGFGQYYVDPGAVCGLIRILEIIPEQPVRIIFEGSRIGIECQL